ncbi:FAD-binding oxidoreductase [Asanoa hainanensis]|uniref:FAD-binding oxidoreductase n=1 Tax=Asanoa hainanensis TaxID=560556 RepID=UPI000B76D1B5|nr:FAD-binding oxidoreductase [Asanoa hainanensis]
MLRADAVLGRELDVDRVELTIQAVHDGEVSPYLLEGMNVGDPIEIRGPAGQSPWYRCSRHGSP